MLPNGFKKDSRVWLHKNSRTAIPRPLGRTEYNGGKRCHVDDCYCNSPVGEHPLITDVTGRVFKKDSRTWLHKSSARKLARTPSGGFNTVTAAKVAKRLHESMQQNRLNRDSFVDNTRGSVEVSDAPIRNTHVHHVTSIQGRTSHFIRGDAPCQRISRIAQKPRFRQTCSSFHDMRPPGPGERHEVNNFVSDLCLFDSKTPGRRKDNSSSDSGSDSDTDRPEIVNRRLQSDVHQHDIHDKEGGVCKLCTTCCDATVQITRDGLQQLQWMLQRQSRQKPSTYQNVSDGEREAADRHNVKRMNLSPQDSESTVDLHANVSLSQELVQPTGREDQAMVDIGDVNVIISNSALKEDETKG